MDYFCFQRKTRFWGSKQVVFVTLSDIKSWNIKGYLGNLLYFGGKQVIIHVYKEEEIYLLKKNIVNFSYFISKRAGKQYPQSLEGEEILPPESTSSQAVIQMSRKQKDIFKCTKVLQLCVPYEK